MNCKPGDLAMVISACECPINLGRVIKVTKVANLGGFVAVVAARAGRIYWEFEGDLRCNDGDACEIVDDAVLKPIRDNDGQDETLTWAGLPAKIQTPEAVK